MVNELQVSLSQVGAHKKTEEQCCKDNLQLRHNIQLSKKIGNAFWRLQQTHLICSLVIRELCHRQQASCAATGNIKVAEKDLKKERARDRDTGQVRARG